MVDSLVIYHNGDYRGNYQDDIPFLKTKAANIDLAFTSCVWQEQWTYYRINYELIMQFQPKAVFPMHVGVGDEDDYFGPFQETFQPLMTDGSVILTNNIKGTSYSYNDGQIIQRTAVESKSNSAFTADYFQLKQNYPNPFNPKTNIKYSITTENYVLLKIYDILGDEITTLVNKTQQPGYYQTEFESKSLSSGIYFYRLQVGGHNQIKKMTLLK
jgi:hypothetical protein